MDASKDDAVPLERVPDQTTTWALERHEERLAQKWDLAGHADLLRANGLNKEAMLNLGESTLMLALQELHSSVWHPRTRQATLPGAPAAQARSSGA